MIMCSKDCICEMTRRFKWSHLTLLFIPLIITLTLAFHEKHSLIYTPFAFAVAALILFVNFPYIVLVLHSRPIYYDDLIVKDFNSEDESVKIYDSDFRKKYQNIFRWVTTITSTVMVGLIAELWYFRADYFPNAPKNGVVTGTVLISIIGGLTRIYYGASLLIGRIIMWILRHYKRREIEKQRQQNQEEVQLEITNTGVMVSQPDDDPLLHRSHSCSDIQIVSLKPTVMPDVFN